MARCGTLLQAGGRNTPAPKPVDPAVLLTLATLCSFLLREGGSIPIVTDFKKILGADALILRLALPDGNAHSPNEKFSLDAFAKGMRMSAQLWQELANR